MTNGPSSYTAQPSAPVEPVHANPTERYLYEIWREQRKQSDMQVQHLKWAASMQQKLTDISGRMLVLVLGLVILPWIVGIGIAFLSVLMTPTTRIR